MGNKIIYKEGDRIGKCEYLNDEPSIYSGRSSKRVARFKCECGAEFTATIDHVKSGITKSCGCFKSAVISKLKRKHGETKSQEHNIWCKIRSRCLNKKHKQYSDYGGRGVGISSDWMEFSSFLRDMGKRPSKNHSVERMDNDKGYSKDNCKWATPHEQTRNMRRNILVEYNGEKRILKDWAIFLNMPYRLIWKRLRVLNWTVEQSLTTAKDREKRYLYK
jgi:hypothetical protein